VKPFPLSINGFSQPLSVFVHDSRDQHVSKTIAETGVWEAYETQLVIERLRADSVFVDVGANIGYYTVIAAAMMGERGRVFSFEPDPQNFYLLQRNLQHNHLTGVDAVDAALADEDTLGRLYLNQDNFGDHQIYDDGTGRQSRSVRLLHGERYLSARVASIDLLKVDTQGAEYHVIKGLLPLLKKSRDQLSIIIEFWPYGLRKAGASGQALVDLLAQLQLPCRIIDHSDAQLIDCSEKQLREWVDMVDAEPDNQGFMNILIGR
jgi:FkbM family methyltransferase